MRPFFGLRSEIRRAQLSEDKATIGTFNRFFE